MPDFKETPITIRHQGVVRINLAYEYVRNDNVMLLEIDLHTKYAEIGGYSETESGAPEIYLGAGGNTIYTEPNNIDDTAFSLDEFAGWDIFTADICKYTLRVALVRRPEF